MTKNVSDEMPAGDVQTLESVVRSMPTDTALLVAALGVDVDVVAILKARQLSMAPVVMKQSLRVRVFQFARDKTGMVAVSKAVNEAGFEGYYRGFISAPAGAASYWEGPGDLENGIDMVVVGSDADPRDALAWRPRMRPGGVVWLTEQGVAV